MYNNIEIRSDLINGNTSLGIELGSTRVKAVLLNPNFNVIASSNVEWESYINEDGYWTYDEDSIWEIIQLCFSTLRKSIKNKYKVELTRIGSIGISGMMHGYLVLNKNDELLVPFRTWRNTATIQASKILTDLFQYNIPQRFSISHLYQAVLNSEFHVNDITYMTTLSGYIHWKLTGKKVLGIGDASGMFPINISTNNYDQNKINKFDNLLSNDNFNWTLGSILPEVLIAGQSAGNLTKEGANLLDPSGNIEIGIPFCPPEGDAGTGMVATNSITPHTANVSAGTSAFAMIVLEDDLSNYYEEIDLVTTPSGNLVAMVHTNNCSTEINSWVKLFSNLFELFNIEVSDREIFTKLFQESENSDDNLGDLLLYGYHSGEHITSVTQGHPLFIRSPQSKFDIANLMAANLYSAFATLKIGMNILFNKENISVTNVIGHGGIFQTPLVAQRVLAACMETNVSVFNTASNGGAWGMAILAQFFLVNKSKPISLSKYLSNFAFIDSDITTLKPTTDEIRKFNNFVEKYEKVIPIVKEYTKNSTKK